MKISKRWRQGLSIVAAIVAGLLVGLYLLAPSIILHPRRANFSLTPADVQAPFEKISVVSADSLVLRGYWIHRPGDTARTTLLLLHGIGGCKERWIPTAAWLWRNGYDAIVYDARAHGESEGQYCTYGYYEKHDVSAFVDFVERNSPGSRVGIWGNSLGGAVALQALEQDKRLQFGLVESTFANFHDVVLDYQTRMFKLPSRWFANDGIARAAAVAHFEPDAVRPVRSARNIRQPVFLAHGDADDRVKVDYGRQIFENLASSDKELHIVPGANHFTVMDRGGQAYKGAVLAFIGRQAKEK